MSQCYERALTEVVHANWEAITPVKHRGRHESRFGPFPQEFECDMDRKSFRNDDRESGLAIN